MENTRVFESTLSLRECVELDENGMLTETGAAALEVLAETLRAYGMAVEVSTTRSSATIRICHPEPHEAKKLRNRGGGRPRKSHDYKGITLDWLASHSVDEGMHALGDVSRRTYYRRLEELRAKGGKTA